ncbi:hypothetical protein N7495_004777 [Penicillium taxi]|uniref:uncharacterized protein n=1 Tax=Penicillium taxi TaxID=168475 RepID=UPI0025457909|nr:uncharacterized protein N7495_004777 [Penicillium taxi]KAJ5900033.1 hypothetical protein N7495_004777 [Penicillium taxi]
MSAPVGPVLQQLTQLPARSRQGLNNLRQRLFQQGEKPKRDPKILLTSFTLHRPVWVTAGGGLYTSLVGVYLTMRAFRHIR